MSEWKPISEWTNRDGNHVIGWNEKWGVAEFMHSDSGWAVSAFNGQTLRSMPDLWQPMPKSPETDRQSRV